MRRSLVFAVLGLMAAFPLAGQTAIGPEPALDSTSAALRDALVALRDSLATIDGAAARMQRDYQAASGPALTAKARLMRDACARSIRTVAPTRKAVVAAELAGDQKVKRRRELVTALDSLRRALGRCETEFAAMSKEGQAEQVRGYGNDRAAKVQGELRRYEHAVGGFLQVMGIRILPLGVSTQTSAG
jgi:hypothetical protein